MIKVGIVEDNIDLRANYSEFLDMSGQYSVIWMFDGVEDFLSADPETPNVILLDINLTGMSGVEGFPLIKAKFPLAHIIILSAYDNEEYVKDLLKKGASGYVLKTASMSEIQKYIEAVLEGGFSISPNAARHLVAEYRHDPIAELQDKLTKREYELVKLLAEGLSYKEAAERLFVTKFTINQHLKHIYNKLSINSKAELMAKMIK
jgi:DNA-binding NarL/FixJ family response regulator